MQSFEHHLQKLGLAEAPIVRKLGGSTAADIPRGTRHIRREHDLYLRPTAVVLSAFRNGDLHMTNQLLAMSEQLDTNDIESVERSIQVLRQQLQALLQQDEPVPNPFVLLQRYLQQIRDGAEYCISPHGYDRVLRLQGTSCSFPCIGEYGSTLVYSTRLNERMRYAANGHVADAFPIETHEHAIRSLDNGEQQAFAQGLLCEFLRRSYRDALVPLIPGYLPHNATQRGYSDITAIDTSIATRTVTGSQTVCAIEKEFPILHEPPTGGQNAASIDTLSCAEAYDACQDGGFAAGVVHPRAITRALENDIPIIVHNPFDTELGATLIR